MRKLIIFTASILMIMLLCLSVACADDPKDNSKDDPEFYTVTFVDHDGTTLKEESVEEEKSATAPAVPSRDYYIFDKWDKDFSKITQDLTVTALYKVNTEKPTISFGKQPTAYSISAGETLTLPVPVATDNAGKDISEDVQIVCQSTQIKDGEFSSDIAQKHIVYYRVTDIVGNNSDIVSIEVDVSPFHDETVLSKEENDLSKLSTDGTFKENFAKGTESPLVQNILTDSVYISGNKDAIAGNSLFIDYPQFPTPAFFTDLLTGMMGYGVYKIEFDLKLIRGEGEKNWFAGFYQSDSSQINQNFDLSSMEIGDIEHFVFEAAGIKEHYFYCFTMSETTNMTIALDNFVITYEEGIEVENSVPTQEELKEGYTWDWTQQAMNVSGAMIVETPKDLQGKNGFSANSLKITSGGNHYITALDGLLVPGKSYDIEFVYSFVKFDSTEKKMHVGMYGIESGKHLFDPNSYAGWDEKEYSILKFKHTWKVDTSAANYINLYFNPLNSVELYVGAFTVTESKDFVPTKEELNEGATWDWSNRITTVTNAEIVDRPSEITGEGFSDKVLCVRSVSGQGTTYDHNFISLIGIFEEGKTYELSFKYSFEHTDDVVNVGTLSTTGLENIYESKIEWDKDSYSVYEYSAQIKFKANQITFSLYSPCNMVLYIGDITIQEVQIG